MRGWEIEGTEGWGAGELGNWGVGGWDRPATSYLDGSGHSGLADPLELQALCVCVCVCVCVFRCVLCDSFSLKTAGRSSLRDGGAWPLWHGHFGFLVRGRGAWPFWLKTAGPWGLAILAQDCGIVGPCHFGSRPSTTS